MSKEFVSCRKLMMFIHSHVSELTSPKNAAQSKCETRVSALYCSCAELCSTRNTILCVKQENGTNERLLSFVPITEISSSYSRTQATMYRVKNECSLCTHVNLLRSVVNQGSSWEIWELQTILACVRCDPFSSSSLLEKNSVSLQILMNFFT